MKVELINTMGDDLTVVNAARVSFDKESDWEWEKFPAAPHHEGEIMMSSTLSEKDIAWVSGIIEGEGCFSIFQKKSKNYKSCAIHCEMTDEDTVRKLHKILNVGKINYRAPRLNRKPSWILSIQRQKEIFDTLIKIMPYLNKRRLKKSKELFNYLEPLCT